MDVSRPTFDATLNPVDDSVPMDRRGWREMTFETALLVPNLVKLVVRLLGDRRVPVRKKVLLGAALLYVISPIDLIPDFIVGFGRVDDVRPSHDRIRSVDRRGTLGWFSRRTRLRPFGVSVGSRSSSREEVEAYGRLRLPNGTLAAHR